MSTPTPPEAVVRRGHDLAWDPPHGLSQVRRWTCRHRDCGSAVLDNRGNVYGQATEQDCVQLANTWKAGDVVRNADDPDDTLSWAYIPDGPDDGEPWLCLSEHDTNGYSREEMPERLTLLVRGGRNVGRADLRTALERVRDREHATMEEIVLVNGGEPDHPDKGATSADSYVIAVAALIRDGQEVPW